MCNVLPSFLLGRSTLLSYPDRFESERLSDQSLSSISGDKGQSRHFCPLFEDQGRGNVDSVQRPYGMNLQEELHPLANSLGQLDPFKELPIVLKAS